MLLVLTPSCCMSADELTNDLGTRRLPTRGIFKTTHWATQDHARLHKNLQFELHVSLQGQRETHTHTVTQPAHHALAEGPLCQAMHLHSWALPTGKPTALPILGTKETGDSAHLANLIFLILMCMSLQLRNETCTFKEIETYMHTQTHTLEPHDQS